jgi:hypothetical protein
MIDLIISIISGGFTLLGVILGFNLGKFPQNRSLIDLNYNNEHWSFELLNEAGKVEENGVFRHLLLYNPNKRPITITEFTLLPKKTVRRKLLLLRKNRIVIKNNKISSSSKFNLREIYKEKLKKENVEKKIFTLLGNPCTIASINGVRNINIDKFGTRKSVEIGAQSSIELTILLPNKLSEAELSGKEDAKELLEKCISKFSKEYILIYKKQGKIYKI